MGVKHNKLTSASSAVLQCKDGGARPATAESSAAVIAMAPADAGRKTKKRGKPQADASPSNAQPVLVLVASGTF